MAVTTGLTSACNMLRADHRLIERSIDELLDAAKHPAPGLLEQVRGIFAEIQALTSPHFTREECIFYPRLRAIAPEILAQMDEQHAYIHEVEDSLRELLSAAHEPLGPRESSELVRFSIELFDTVQHHIVDEEDKLLRFADVRLSAEEQRELVEEMRTATAT